MLQTSRQYRWRKDMPGVDATRLPAMRRSPILHVSAASLDARRYTACALCGEKSAGCRISGSNTLPGEDAMRAMHVSAAAAIVVACAWASLSAQAQSQPYSGNGDYQAYCSSCHGPEAKGDGVIAKSLKKRPSDLTQLSIRNNGTFPEQKVFAAIDGRNEQRARRLGHAGLGRCVRQSDREHGARACRRPHRRARAVPRDVAGEEMTRPVRASLALLALLTVSTAQAQGPALDRVMHKKLEVSQQILEAVVTSRWDALEARSRELEALTNDPAGRPEGAGVRASQRRVQGGGAHASRRRRQTGSRRDPQGLRGDDAELRGMSSLSGEKPGRRGVTVDAPCLIAC